MELDEGSVFVPLGHNKSKHCIYRYTQHTAISNSQSRIFSFSKSVITVSTVYHYCWKFLSYLLSYRSSSHFYQYLTLSRRFVSIILTMWDQNHVHYSWSDLICGKITWLLDFVFRLSLPTNNTNVWNWFVPVLKWKCEEPLIQTFHLRMETYLLSLKICSFYLTFGDGKS